METVYGWPVIGVAQRIEDALNREDMRNEGIGWNNPEYGPRDAVTSPDPEHC